MKEIIVVHITYSRHVKVEDGIPIEIEWCDEEDKLNIGSEVRQYSKTIDITEFCLDLSSVSKEDQQWIQHSPISSIHKVDNMLYVGYFSGHTIIYNEFNGVPSEDCRYYKYNGRYYS